MDAGIAIPDEIVINKILIVRGKKVMIDTDLAELYAVPTRRLNEQVRRNIKRFPEDFMFQHDSDIKLIFKYLKELLNPPAEPMRKIGFKHWNEG